MVTAGTLLLALALAGQDPGGAVAQRSRTRAAERPPAAEAPMTQADAAELRRMIEELTRQVTLLRQEISAQRQQAARDARASQRATDQRRFNADQARLKLIEDERTRLRQQRNELMRQRREAEDRADRAQAGLDNVQSQMIGAIELDRNAAEARIRRTLTRQLEQATADVQELGRQIDLIDIRLGELDQAAAAIRDRLGITPESAGEEEPEEPEEPAVLDAGETPDLGRP